LDRRDMVITRSRLQAIVHAIPRAYNIDLQGCQAIMYATA
jgi:hypothetical protein